MSTGATDIVTQESGQVICDTCGELHTATYHHEGSFGEGAVYEVTCPQDGLADYYLTERLVRGAARITWWVYAGDERIRRQASMRGTWSFDATCSCGWDSRTGGALERYVMDKVADHKRYDH